MKFLKSICSIFKSNDKQGSLLDRQRAKFRLYAMNKGSKFESIDISEIPKQWEKFPNTDDEWIEVEMPEDQNYTACMYKGKKGSFFKPHKHPTQIEHLIVMSGKIESITYNAVKTLEFPQSLNYKKDEVHAVEFIEDTTILVIWSPRFKTGWKAEFEAS